MLSQFARQDACWHSDRDGVGWHVRYHYRIGTDRDVVADTNRTEHLGARPNIYTIANYRGAALASRTKANRYAIAQDAIIAEYSVAADDNPTEVVDAESPSDRRLTRQFNSGQYFRHRFE
jgi:hypothetical protein